VEARAEVAKAAAALVAATVAAEMTVVETVMA